MKKKKIKTESKENLEIGSTAYNGSLIIFMYLVFGLQKCSWNIKGSFSWSMGAT